MRRAQHSLRFHVLCGFCGLVVALFAFPGAVRGGTASAGDPGIAATVGVIRFDNPSYSPDGKWIAMSDGRRDAIYLYSTADSTAFQIANTPSGGYAFNWAADGSKLGFKLLVPNGQSAFPLQTPVFFHLGKQTLIALHPAVRRAGVPSFSAKGWIAYTVEQELRIADESGTTITTFALDHYANLTPISPDGTKVAYSDRDERLCLIDLATGDRRQLTADENGYFNPVWSPDSSRLVVNTVSGRLKAIEVSTGQTYELGAGSSPSWAPDSRTIFFAKVDRLAGIRVNRADICQVQFDGSGMSTLTEDAGTQAIAARVASDGSKVVFVSLADGELYQAPLIQDGVAAQKAGAVGTAGADAASIAYQMGPAVKIALDDTPTAALEGTLAGQTGLETLGPPITPAVETQLSRSVPYLHQAYDTPDNFNGDWACNATSAMMCLAYYSRLPYWDITCSWPYSHTSHYGQYISRVYSYNGYTYNIGSADASGVTAWGGYGYIVRNNWADTKGYMRDYFNNHNVSSVVDWSPTFAELQAEVNSQYPLVLLNMLTSAGHYIVAIGYVDGQYTAIFNDPWGNKNISYPGYNGAGARYDWPGYNNGYQNLNGAECFIYARSSTGPTITQQPSNQVVAPLGTATFTVAASGTGLSYQWRKDGVNLSNGGKISGATATTLQITSCNAADQGGYQCVVTNTSGSTTSNSATLTVSDSVVIVESRPGGQNVAKYSESGVFADSSTKSTAAGVTAGIGCRYGSTYFSVAGEKHAYFDADLSAAGSYEVFATWGTNTARRTPILHRVTHADGTTDVNVDQTATANVWVSLGTFNFDAGSNVGRVDVNNLNIDVSGSLFADAVKWEYRGAPPAPSITQQPVAQNVCPGTTAAFSVAASGLGTLAYQWQKNGANLANGGHYSGVTATTLSVSTADAGDAASYRCIVSNTGGSVNSNAAALTLRAATTITSQPVAQVVCPGGTATFTVAGTGEGTLAYQWQKNGVDLSDGGHYSGATTTMLTISSADSGDVAEYACAVAGGCGIATSTAAALAVTAATITLQPASQTVCPGGTATFSVAATGGALTYQWQKNGVDLSEGGHYSGVTTPALTVANADGADTMNYRCVVTDACATVTSNAVSLSFKPVTVITQQPSARNVCTGAQTTFTVTAAGDGALSYQWQKDGSDLDNGGHYFGVTAATLMVSNVDNGDVGDYRCVVAAGCGSTTSTVASLTLRPTVAADLDRDADVDLNDFTVFRACFNGPNRPPAFGCPAGADFDGDSDVDLDDFSTFRGCFNGPNRPVACAS